MGKSEKIGHPGIVKNISGETVEVAISSQTACSGCHTKGACGLSSVKEKIITVQHPGFAVKQGDNVTVYAGVGNAMFAVLMSYVIPVIVIIATIITVQAAGYGELASAVTALAATGVYYIILYLNKRRLTQRITFTLEKTDE